MNDFEASLLNAKEALYSNDLIKIFLNLNERINNDEIIQSLLKLQKNAQHNMCKFVNDNEKYNKYRSEFLECSNKLESNPLYANFINIKEEVFSLLEEIKETLE